MGKPAEGLQGRGHEYSYQHPIEAEASATKTASSEEAKALPASPEWKPLPGIQAHFQKMGLNSAPMTGGRIFSENYRSRLQEMLLGNADPRATQAMETARNAPEAKTQLAEISQMMSNPELLGDDPLLRGMLAAQAKQYLSLAGAMQGTAEDSAFVNDELNNLAQTAFQILHDDGLRRGDPMTPLYEAYLLFTQRKQAEGEKVLLSIRTKIPEADALLTQLESNRLRALNFLAVDAWKSYNREGEAILDDASRGVVGQVAGFIDYLARDDENTYHDDRREEWAREEKLIREIEVRIRSGQAITMKEALEQIEKTGPEELRGQASFYLVHGNRAAKGFVLGDLIDFTAKYPPDPKLAEVVLQKTWELECDNPVVNAPYAIYALVHEFAPNDAIRERAKFEMDALTGEAGVGRSVFKFIASTSPEGLALNVLLMAASAGAANVAMLATMAKLEQIGMGGFKALALARATGVGVEVTTLWAGNTAVEAMAHDVNQVFTADHLLTSYLSTAVMIVTLKGFGAAGQSVASKAAGRFGLVAEGGKQLTRGGRALVWGIGHTSGMAGMVASSHLNQALGFHPGHTGGWKEGLVHDVFGYVQFALAHKTADRLLGGKLSRIGGRQHLEIKVRQNSLLAQGWAKRLGFDYPRDAKGRPLRDAEGKILAGPEYKLVYGLLVETSLNRPDFSGNKLVKLAVQGKYSEANSYLASFGVALQLGAKGELIAGLPAKTTPPAAPGVSSPAKPFEHFFEEAKAAGQYPSKNNVPTLTEAALGMAALRPQPSGSGPSFLKNRAQNLLDQFEKTLLEVKRDPRLLAQITKDAEAMEAARGDLPVAAALRRLDLREVTTDRLGDVWYVWMARNQARVLKDPGLRALIREATGDFPSREATYNVLTPGVRLQVAATKKWGEIFRENGMAHGDPLPPEKAEWIFSQSLEVIDSLLKEPQGRRFYAPVTIEEEGTVPDQLWAARRGESIATRPEKIPSGPTLVKTEESPIQLQLFPGGEKIFGSFENGNVVYLRSGGNDLSLVASPQAKGIQAEIAWVVDQKGERAVRIRPLGEIPIQVFDPRTERTDRVRVAGLLLHPGQIITVGEQVFVWKPEGQGDPSTLPRHLQKFSHSAKPEGEKQEGTGEKTVVERFGPPGGSISLEGEGTLPGTPSAKGRPNREMTGSAALGSGILTLLHSEVARAATEQSTAGVDTTSAMMLGFGLGAGLLVAAGIGGWHFFGRKKSPALVAEKPPEPLPPPEKDSPNFAARRPEGDKVSPPLEPTEVIERTLVSPRPPAVAKKYQPGRVLFSALEDNEGGRIRRGTFSQKEATAEYGTASASTHEGIGYKPQNEDGFVQGSNWALVLDGVGGSKNGDKASALAGKTFGEYMTARGSEGDLAKAMLEAARAIQECESKIGSTVAVAHRIVKRTDGSAAAQIAHVGDAGAMVLRPNGKGEFELVFRTQEHTRAAELREAGILGNTLQMRASDASYSVTDFLGKGKTPSPVLSEVPLKKGDVILMFSDGIGDNFDKGELMALVKGSRSPEEAQARIMERAKFKMRRLDKALAILQGQKTSEGKIVSIRNDSGSPIRAVEFGDAPGFYLDARGDLYQGTQGNKVDHYKKDNVTLHVYFHELGVTPPRSRPPFLHPAVEVHDLPTRILPVPTPGIRKVIQLEPAGYWLIPNKKQNMIIGRGAVPGEGIQLSGKNISLHHAELLSNQGEYFLRDLGSTFGTTLNGEKLEPMQAKALQPGDLIVFSEVRGKSEGQAFQFDIIDGLTAGLMPALHLPKGQNELQLGKVRILRWKDGKFFIQNGQSPGWVQGEKGEIPFDSHYFYSLNNGEHLQIGERHFVFRSEG